MTKYQDNANHPDNRAPDTHLRIQSQQRDGRCTPIERVRFMASEVSGREVKVAGTQGSLDVAYAVKVTGLPACCFGIGRRTKSNAHAEDENIRIDDLVMYMKFLGKLIGKGM